jgi:hypothetical protein
MRSRAGKEARFPLSDAEAKTASLIPPVLPASIHAVYIAVRTFYAVTVCRTPNRL